MLPATPQQALSRRRLRETAVLYTLFVVPGIVAGGAPDPSFRSLLALALRSAAFTLLVLYLLDLQGEQPWRTSAARGARALVGVALVAALLATSAATAWLLAQSDLVRAQPIGSGPALLAGTRAWWRYPTIILTMVAVGYSEELFFRAYLIHRLRQLGVATAIAVVVATVLFAVGHLWQGVTGTVYALAAGSILAIAWVGTRDLHLIAWSHAAYNVLAITMAAG